MPPSNDPGWRPALRGIWWPLVPGQLVGEQRRVAAAGTHGVVVLRRVFLGFVVAVVLAGVVVVVLSAATPTLTQHPLPAPAVALGIVVIGVVALGAQRSVERPLDCSDDARMAGSYGARFFLRVAFSHSLALVGFVGFILTNAGWLYALGAAFTAVGCYRLAPTTRNLAKDQQALTAAGCQRSLVKALAFLPPSGGRR